jgi:Icc-related predicted phosphoesterase
MSDLHLEFNDLELPGGDILILSGDVCEAKNLKQNYDPNNVMHDAASTRRLDRYIRFFMEECTKYRHVLYVMGNHEHYGFRFDKTYSHINAHLPDNVILLENQSVELDGILFVGATLWTDCNKNDPLTYHHIKFNLNDYNLIKQYYVDSGKYYKLTPEYTHKVHKETLSYFKNVLDQNKNKKVVVVTHHGPSKQSIHPRYRDDYHMNGGYSSNLDQFILDHPQIKFWTHGHTHDTFDYMIGQCRVICNPRGYTGYERRAKEFDPAVGFDIES